MRKIKGQESVHVNIRLPLSRTTGRFHIGVAVVTELQPRTSTPSKSLTKGRKKRKTRKRRPSVLVRLIPALITPAQHHSRLHRPGNHRQRTLKLRSVERKVPEGKSPGAPSPRRKRRREKSHLRERCRRFQVSEMGC